MTTEVLDVGVDVHVQEARDTTANPDSPQPPMSATSNARKWILLRFGQLAEKSRGRVITSAVLEGRTRIAHTSYTLAVHALAGSPAGGFDAYTWRKAQNVGVIAGGVTATIPARAAGERWSVEIGGLVQQIANGATHFGFRLAPSTGGDRPMFGFDTPDPDRDWWRLIVTYEDEPDADSGLVPDGGVVSQPKPVLTWTSDEPAPEDADVSAQVAYQVQVSHATLPSATSPTYDSGTVNRSTPSHDLNAPPSGPAYTAPAAEAPRWWRQRSKTAGGPWREWSDWAFFPWAALPTITLLAPVPDGNGLAKVSDSTPLIQARVNGTVETFRVLLTPTAGSASPAARKYDSDEIEGPAPVSGVTTFDYEIPLKAGRDQTRVLDDDQVYDTEVRVEDRTDRVSAVGAVPYASLGFRIQYDHDASIAPPSSVVARQVRGTDGNPIGVPAVEVVVRRTTAPLVWEISRGGKVVGLIEHDDQLAEDGPMVPTGTAGEWVWTHHGVRPLIDATYSVCAMDTNAQGKVTRSAAVAATPVRVTAHQVWLYLARVGYAQLRGAADVFDRGDNRETIEPQGEQRPFDLIYAQRGIDWDSFEGTVTVRPGEHPAAESLRVLQEIQDRPTATIRLIWGDQSIPVILRDVFVSPDQDMSTTNLRHLVVFGGFQNGEIRSTKPGR